MNHSIHYESRVIMVGNFGGLTATALIHGHIHNQRNHAYEILKTLPRVLNAGVDINFYRPVPLDELVENNRKYYSEEYPELFPVPPRPDRSAPGLMPRKPDFRPLPQRH